MKKTWECPKEQQRESRRPDRSAIKANEREEIIMKALKDISESAPGEDGVKVGYITGVCEGCGRG